MPSTLVVVDSVLTPGGVAGDAVAIRAGRIEAVGWADQLRSPGQTEERYAGATLVGGLGDAHFHPTGYTSALTRLNVSSAASFDDLIAAVRQAERHLGPGEPIIGTRLDDEHLAERSLPDRSVLDAATTRPALLYRYCGHVAVANTPALEAAGIGPATPDPRGGSLDRGVDGRPTGVLRETAVDLVAGSIGGRSTGQTPDELNRALRGLVQQGVTTLGAIIRAGDGVWCGVGDELDLLCAAAPELPLDLSVFVIADSPAELETAAIRLNAAGRRIRFAGYKTFVDGSLGGHTAAMFEPFADQATTGTLRFDADQEDRLARASIDLGGAVAMHAIGDRANDAALAALAAIRDDHPEALLRIEHASVLRPQDIDRFAEHAIVASVQPAFLASETDWLAKRVGPDRLRHTYAFRSLVEAGAMLAGGSDCPVEPPNPLLGMATARDRHGIVPEESLDASIALEMFTSGVATALGQPAPLEPGSRAHFTLFDRDPVAAEPAALRAMEPIATWIDGASVAADPEALLWR